MRHQYYNYDAPSYTYDAMRSHCQGVEYRYDILGHSDKKTCQPSRFTGYFRDAETGLDYADQRYHQPGMGRFMSADQYMASGGPQDPGSWNRYAYVGGDPVNYTDRSGRNRVFCGDDDSNCGDPYLSGGDNGGGGSDPYGALPGLPCGVGAYFNAETNSCVPDGASEDPASKIKVPTSIRLVCDTGSIPAGSGGVATRQEKYEVFDQDGNFISDVQEREVLKFLPGGAQVCPVGTTLQGNSCIGGWNAPGGIFYDSQSVLFTMQNLAYVQSFQFQIAWSASDVPPVGSQGSLFASNNYITVGQGVNVLSVTPTTIMLNSNTAGMGQSKCF
jgi:RHS repeat-associated protein